MIIIVNPLITKKRINRWTSKTELAFPFGKLTIKLRIGRIEEISGASKDSAIVLPANTSFVDDCITDCKSALGAFIMKIHPDKILNIQSDINTILSQNGHQKDLTGLYPPGTTIVLPTNYNMPAKLLITASTTRIPKIGIIAEPSTVCRCVYKILEITADKKIDELYMPLIGSGHGKLDINDSLLLIILTLKHYHSNKNFSHIKTVNIIITDDDVVNLKKGYGLKCLMAL